MKRRWLKSVLGCLLAVTLAFPANMLAVAADEPFVVDDTVTSGTHYFTYTPAVDPNGQTGWSADVKDAIQGSHEAKTQHWVWNENYDEAKKHTYTFTFEGTGVELVGVKNDAQNTFQLDNEEPETVTITGQPFQETVLYSRKGLDFGVHTVAATLPRDMTGLQVSYARVYGADSGEVTVEKETVAPDMQSGDYNVFRYTAYAGKSWTANASEAYIDLGASDARAEECYYEIPFVGNRIDITATKGPVHGKVRFTVDGVNETVADLYNSGSRVDAVVYSASGLSEGPHTLKAVTLNEKSGSKVVNQVVKAEIYHAPYQVTDLVLESASYTLLEGATQKIAYRVVPDYAEPKNLIFASDNETVVTVDEAGVITAISEGTATISMLCDGLFAAKTLTVTVAPTVPQLSGSIVNSDLHYTQDKYEQVKAMGTVEGTLSVWKNDQAVSEIALVSKESALRNVTVTASDFTGDAGTISASQVTATFIKSAQAYTERAWGNYPAPTADNRKESPDILYQTAPMNIPFNHIQPVWVAIDVPKDAPAGRYTGTLRVTADGIDTPLTFTYHLEVADAVLPDATDFKDGFDIELWQYPYTSAEYYGVEPFSERHLEILRPEMEKYRSIGGHAITTTIVDEAWNGQTYSKNEVHYPSMVQWTKHADGTFSYDYTDFDKWVQFNKDLGIGNKIVCYSVAPWHNSFKYYDETTGQNVTEAFTAGTQRYNQVWGDFLRDLTAHLEEKGWFNDAYIGIDERGFSNAAFDLIESITNSQGEHLKTAGAMDSFVEKKALAMRVSDLNVGDTAVKAHPADFAQLIQDREALRLRTTLYSCTGHKPGNFSLSAPGESYWGMLYSASMGGVGFLRWAYDAWVEDPLRDTTHSSFEAGDCFLIFPDERDAEHPVSKSSVRLEKMAQGVRDANKLFAMKREVPAMASEVDTLLSTVKPYSNWGGGYISTPAQQQLMADDMAVLRTGLEELTKRYIELKGGASTDVESVTIDGGDVSLPAGNTKQLHATVKPDSVLNPNVTWSSADPAVASVSSAGLLTAHAMGTTTVTAASQQDPSKADTIRVTVTEPAIDPAALVSYYSFDNLEGNHVPDEWNGHDAVNQGAALVDGRAGKALHFSEGGQQVTVDDPETLTGNWTIACWVNFEGANETASIFWDGNPFASESAQSGSVSLDARRDAAEAKMAVHVQPGYLTMNYTLPQNVWKHVAMTNDGTELRLYIDGTQVANNTWNQNSTIVAPIKVLGGRGFAGSLDDVKIFNRALTAQEIAIAKKTRGLNLNSYAEALYVGDTFAIEADLVSDESDKTITYTSEDPEIASVTAGGVVTANKRGSTRIAVENRAAGYLEYVTITVQKHLEIQSTIPQYTLPEANTSAIERSPGTDRQYLGQPDMVMLDDNKTLYTAYPIGHGKGPLVLMKSTDAGETWQEQETPASWADSRETPTMYKLDFTDGGQKLLLITGCPNWGDGNPATGWNTSISSDGGNTWSEYRHFHDGYPATVAMASLIQLKDANGNYIDKWMGVYHNASFVNYKTYLTFDEDGNDQWTEPVPYLSEYRDVESSHQICEVGMFRSPDGSRIMALARSQTHQHKSTMFYSDDEGETWSRPEEIQGALQGERHKAVYDPVSGRLLITFREIILDYNQNGQIEPGDWRAGDWIAWVGTYEDLLEQNEGQYRILLKEDFSQNTYSGDCGYAGIVVQPDGTYILDSYGHWDEAFSKDWASQGKPVTTDLCYIMQAKFKLSEIDNLAGLIDRTDLRTAIANAAKVTEQGNYTDESWKTFKVAFEKAVAVEGDNGSTQTEINAARKALTEAQNGLTEQTPSGEAHLLNIQYGPNAELEVTGSTEVILDANGIYGATVKGGESITLHFTPVDGTFASALLNGEAIDCTAEDCTYTFTMPDQNKVLRFTFQLVRKDLLGVVLEKAEAVTKEELDKLVPSVQKKFTTALKNAQSVYADLNATQAEVDEAWKDLIDAMHYLNFEKGEKEALEELVHTAEQVKLDEFTPSSQTAFTEALEAARAICAEDEVLKEEVENAYQALHDAIMALVRKADFSALQVLVDEAEGYDLDAYIQNEALKSFQKVLKEASALLDDENASQKVVDEMASELLNAMAALRRVPSKEALEELLRNLEAIGPEGYTAASYAAYRSQVNLMWAVYNDESATDEQIAKACAIGEKAPSLLKSTTTTAKKTSHTVSRSNTYGTAGTAVAVASPVVAAAQHVTAQAYVRSDTTANFTLKQGSAYCFKMTVVNGGDSIPGFTAGNGGVLKTQFVARLGNDYYYRVYAVGAPGTSTGVYTTLPGQNAVKHCVVTIG